MDIDPQAEAHVFEISYVEIGRIYEDGHDTLPLHMRGCRAKVATIVTRSSDCRAAIASLEGKVLEASHEALASYQKRGKKGYVEIVERIDVRDVKHVAKADFVLMDAPRGREFRSVGS